MEGHHIDIRRDAVFPAFERRVAFIRFEADVVAREVAAKLQVVIDDLLENVFFHSSTVSISAVDSCLRSTISIGASVKATVSDPPPRLCICQRCLSFPMPTA